MTFARHLLRAVGWLALVVVLLLAGPVLTLAFGGASMRGDWRTATHHATGLAPDAAAHPEAIVQVYASRTFGWRGAFAVHTWVAAKPAGALRYTRYEVIGWRAMGGRSALSISDDVAPDAEWYGAAPTVIRELRGPEAEAVIARLPAAAASYPYATRYSAWPGPNSNTFTAWVGRAVPELRLKLPSTAIGKDFLPGAIADTTPSGTGVQLSLFGLTGLAVGWDEGIEVNLLTLNFGLEVKPPALKLPLIGRIGPS